MARGIFERGSHLNIILYQFAKKLNSTARPNGTAKGVQGQLRESCSILAPEVGFTAFGQTESPRAWNYAYIPDFGRFYFVDNWTWARGMWYANMTVDPLASWRTEIANSSEYIVRAASAYNPNVIDTTYPTVAGCNQALVDITGLFTDQISQGTFIMSVQAGGDQAKFGTNTTLLCTPGAMYNFAQKLLANTDYLDIDPNEISGNLAKALFNPIQYISYLMWIPVSVRPTDLKPLSSVPLGWWSIDAGAGFFVIDENHDKVTWSHSLVIPRHQQADGRHKFLRAAPYSEYKLYMPGFGLLDIEASKLYNMDSLTVKIVFDLYTGNMTLQLMDGDKPFQTLSGCCAVQAQIGQIASMVSSGSGIVQAVTGGLVAGAQSFFGQAQDITRKIHDWINGASTVGLDQNVTSIANGIQSGAQQATSESVTKGGQGGVAEYGITPYLQCKFWNIVDQAPEHRGYPLCEIRKIGSLTGFVMCADSDFSAPATSMEISAIRDYLNNGFYFE